MLPTPFFWLGKQKQAKMGLAGGGIRGRGQQFFFCSTGISGQHFFPATKPSRESRIQDSVLGESY